MVPERSKLEASQLKRAKSTAALPDPGFGGVGSTACPDALETLPFNEDQIPVGLANFDTIAIEDSSFNKVFYRINFHY